MADNPLQKLYEALETRDAERLAEINKLTKERDDLVEKLKQFELKSGGKDDQCQCTRSKDDSIMKMYEAQAIAIEKQIEVDKLKEEMNELKEKMDKLKMEKDAEVSKLAREKDDLMELLKRLGKDQEGKSGESGTKMEEMKKKNEELEERLKRLELNRVKEKIIGNPVSKQPQRNTILVLGDSGSNYTCLFLSADRTKWIEIDLTLPCGLPRAVVYLDDELYLIDIPTNGATTNTLYRLDRTLKWTRLVDMKKEHRYIRNSCLVENGYIWVFGGENREGSLASVERYDPKENKWTLMPDMKNARNSAAVTTWNNCIVISGGFEDFLKPTNTVECFNPENGSRTELPNMPKALHSHSLVSYKNKLILMGGFDGQSWLDSVWQLDPSETNPSWSPLPSMKYPSSQFAGIVFDEEIYAIVGKGEKHQLLDRVEIFDGKEWRDGPFLPYPMVNPSAMIIPQHFADLLCRPKKKEKRMPAKNGRRKPRCIDYSRSQPRREDDDERNTHAVQISYWKQTTQKMEEVKSLSDFNNMFDSERELYEYLMKNGYLQNSATCLKCGKEMTLRYKKQIPEWRCRLNRTQDCSTRSVKTGSWFQRISIPMKKALGIIILHCLGYTNQQIVREMKVSPSTVVDYKNFVREICQQIESGYPPIGGNGDVCELDETALHIRKYGRGAPDRSITWVLGGISRNTKRFFACVVDNRTAKTMIPIIRKHVDETSILFTDMFKSYATLKKYYRDHLTLNHSIEFKRIDKEKGMEVCTNTIESFWKRLKAPLRINGTSEALLRGYISETVVRQNEKALFMAAVLDQIKNHVF